MWTWLKQIWTDPAKFTGLVRGVFASVGAAIAGGALGPEFQSTPIGLAIMAASTFLAAGDKNAKP